MKVNFSVESLSSPTSTFDHFHKCKVLYIYTPVFEWCPGILRLYDPDNFMNFPEKSPARACLYTI